MIVSKSYPQYPYIILKKSCFEMNPFLFLSKSSKNILKISKSWFYVKGVWGDTI
jgi:hypothetical protein